MDGFPLKLGDYALGCKQTGDRIARHNRLRDVLFEAAAGAALGPVYEERPLFTTPLLLLCFTS